MDHTDLEHTIYTVCPRSSDQLYVVIYCIKWVTTSWKYSIYPITIQKRTTGNLENTIYTVCPRSSEPLYIVIYYIKWVTILLGHI